VTRIEEYAARAARAGSEFQQAGARGFAYEIARTEAAALLIEHASAETDHVELTAAKRWCSRELAPFVEADADHRTDSVALANGELKPREEPG
jgi:hypothetical protein